MDEIPAALFTFFESMPRQGPGSLEVTAALFERFAPMMPAAPRAADMGCGSGAAGLVLAEKGATVVGVDIHRPFLETFEATAKARGLGDRVETRSATMLDPGLESGSFDLIWSEGAVFTVGFDAALEVFADLSKPGGIAVVSELSWLRRDAPEEARAFWEAGYPGMRTAAGNLAAAEDAGWRFLHAEVLAPEVWESGFYAPMERLMDGMAAKDDPDLAAVMAENRAEIDLFRRFHDSFGYVFYCLRRP